MIVYTLAHELGRRVSEIEALSASERNHWIAYFKLKADD